MGAILSLPLLAVPSAGTLISFAASCCGAATCSAVCSACNKCNNSIATRIAYALILLVNSLLSWIMLTEWAMKKLSHLTLDYVSINCAGKDCYGWLAVHRFNFALGAFHLLMAIILLGVKSSKDGRAPIQNGFWGPKLVAWAGLIVGTFFIPDRFFVTWGNYVALIGAMLFLLLGLILLVDLAHTWAEYALRKIEEGDISAESSTNVRFWRTLLVGSTAGMYLASLAMTIVMYIFFASSGCRMNQSAITINLLLLLAVSVTSISPTVQEYNTRAGLAQSAMVAFYCTYLTLSAVGMEPDDQHCNPLVRANGTRKASVIVGAVVTFLAMAYTTTRAATYGLALGGSAQRGNQARYAQLSQDDASTHDLEDSTQPTSRRQMRAQALQEAVAAGSIPASALDDDSDDEDSDEENSSKKNKSHDDERQATQYNYSLFHIIFLLGTMWVATLLTTSVSNDIGDADFVPVGRTYWASWVKIVSSWVCYAIYAWSLLAPVILPDRFDY
ncbi:MAG: hypothetical protein Q9162_002637 [Coniocarpon cinnabarinum]